MKTNTTVPPTRINTPTTTTAEDKAEATKTETKKEMKPKTVSVTIEVPRRTAKKLERAAKLIGISISRLLEIKLAQV